MQIYLPIAEMAVQAETIAFLGAVVGVISGIFGVGGGFLTTPFLIFLGIPPAVAVGTQASQLVASSSTAVIGHWRKRNIDMKMAGVLLVGGMMLSESVTTLLRSRRSASIEDTPASLDNYKPSRYERLKERLPYKMSFPESRLFISAIIPLFIGFVGGLMVSVMGIGAGFLLVPAMIYLLRMPPLLVAGTSLIQIMVTSAMACILHAVTNQTVDMVLAVILISGSVIGAQIGVRLSHFIKGATARFLLAFIIMLVGLKLGSALLIPPANLYSLVVQ
jgi:uncharacterized membrane protein YfcA